MSDTHTDAQAIFWETEIGSLLASVDNIERCQLCREPTSATFRRWGRDLWRALGRDAERVEATLRKL